MTDKLKLEVLFGAIDQLTRPLKSIKESSGAAAKALKATKDQVKALKDEQKRLTESSVSGHMMLAGQQANLTRRIEEATAAYNRQSRALEAINEKARRMHAAQADYENRIAKRDKMAGAGASAAGAGAAIGLPILKAVKDFATFEDAMLGVARQVDGARDANGKLTATYYEMGDAIKAMSERLPGTANDIAAIVEAGARMGIQGDEALKNAGKMDEYRKSLKENLLIYAETTAVMSKAFDLPVDQVGENVAKLAQLYKVPIKSIGELGDVINYLDDNTISKGGDIIDVMQRIAGTADSVGMKYRDAAALGGTFLSLGAGAEVAASASNAMMRELSIATMQTKRFRDGLKMLKLDAKAIQSGMSTDSTGTILKVLEAIKSLPQEKQLEATTRLFGKEFGDDAAKLAGNLDTYRAQLKLVNDERARGSMLRDNDASSQNLSQQYENVTDRVRNLSSELGRSLKPSLVEILGDIADVLKSVRDWVKEHPELVSNIMKAVAAIGIFLTVIGGLALAAAAVLGPLAAFRFGLSILGVSGAAASGGIMALISPLAKVTAAFSLGYAAGSILNDGLNSWISRLVGYPTTLGEVVFDMVQAFKNADWKDIGKFIVLGIEAGLDILTAGLYSKLKSMSSEMVKTVRETLGIKSPSRVFAQLGEYTMAGLSAGLIGGQSGVINAVRDTAKKLTAIGAGVMIGGAAMAGDIPIDNRPPIGSTRSTASTQQVMQPIINVYASPGMDEAALARLVAREIDKITRQQAAASRSRLRDQH